MIALAKVEAKAKGCSKAAEAVKHALRPVRLLDLSKIPHKVCAKTIEISMTQKACKLVVEEFKTAAEFDTRGASKTFVKQRRSEVSSSIEKYMRDTDACMDEIMNAVEAGVDEQTKHMSKKLKQVHLSDFGHNTEGLGIKAPKQLDEKNHNDGDSDRRKEDGDRRSRRLLRSTSPTSIPRLLTSVQRRSSNHGSRRSHHASHTSAQPKDPYEIGDTSGADSVTRSPKQRSK